MARFPTRTVALFLASTLLTAAPSFAQRRESRGGSENGRREASARVPTRDGGESRGGVQSQQRTEPRQRTESQQRIEPRQRADSAQRIEPRQRVESQQRIEPRQRTESSGRVESRGVEPYRGNDSRRYDNRRYDSRAYDSRAYDNRRYDNRRYDGRAYDNRRYDSRVFGSRSYRTRTYVVPYGYRPYGYRPGWSLNLYFGRPYGVYGYPSAGYGYYALAPGFAYGALRIVDAPRDAEVFVDGYYAGVVDDYDGVFQHLNLEAGPHTIEIELPGYPPIEFDVRIVPGQTITYRADIY